MGRNEVSERLRIYTQIHNCCRVEKTPFGKKVYQLEQNQVILLAKRLRLKYMALAFMGYFAGGNHWRVCRRYSYSPSIKSMRRLYGIETEANFSTSNDNFDIVPADYQKT